MQIFHWRIHDIFSSCDARLKFPRISHTGRSFLRLRLHFGSWSDSMALSNKKLRFFFALIWMFVQLCVKTAQRPILSSPVFFILWRRLRRRRTENLRRRFVGKDEQRTQEVHQFGGITNHVQIFENMVYSTKKKKQLYKRWFHKSFEHRFSWYEMHFDWSLFFSWGRRMLSSWKHILDKDWHKILDSTQH